jgi:hypothetical protein
MSKIILIYNLIITVVFAYTGFTAAKNLNQVIFSFLFLPMAAYFLTALLKRLPKPTFIPSPTGNSLSPIPYTLNPTSISGEELTATEVSDINRRLFLKLIGTAGLTTFLFALFTKSSQAAFFGSMPGPGVVAIKDSQGNKIDPAEKSPTDGYEIAQVDDAANPAYYGFLNKDGHWYIARDNNGEYYYARGTNNFPGSWGIRASLNYDLFNNVF